MVPKKDRLADDDDDDDESSLEEGVDRFN